MYMYNHVYLYYPEFSPKFKMVGPPSSTIVAAALAEIQSPPFLDLSMVALGRIRTQKICGVQLQQSDLASNQDCSIVMECGIKERAIINTFMKTTATKLK